MAQKRYYKRKYKKYKRTFGSYRKSYSGNGGMPAKYRGTFRRSGLYGRFSGSGGRYGGELKYYDQQSSNETIRNFGSIFPRAAGDIIIGSMNLIPTGTGPEEMLGNKVRIKSIEIRGRVTADPDTNASSLVAVKNENFTRVALVLDMQANGTVAAASDIYENSQTFGAAPNIYDFVKIANSKRFRILKEWIFDLNTTPFVGNPNAASSTATLFSAAGISKNLHYYKKCDIEMDFQREATGMARTIAEVRSCNLLICAFSLVDQKTNLQFHWRLRFVDG